MAFVFRFYIYLQTLYPYKSLIGDKNHLLFEFHEKSPIIKSIYPHLYPLYTVDNLINELKPLHYDTPKGLAQCD